MEGMCSFEERLKGFLADYEELLLGKKQRLSLWYCTGNAAYDERLALEVMRYAFEKLLKWTPEMINECKDNTVLDKMKLRYIYKLKVIHPAKKTSHSIFNVIASKLYPDKISLDGSVETINTYKRVLNGEILKFPKSFFQSDDGMLKLGYCFRYALTEKIVFSSVEELYEMFGMPGINAELDRLKLLNVYQMFFETPVDMLHYCIPKTLRNDEYYNNCKQRYLKKRLSYGICRRYIKQYLNYLYCKSLNNPMTDIKGEFRIDQSRTIFYYFLTELLPSDPMIKSENYDFQDRNTLYSIMTRYDIDFILDKYRIRDLVRSVSDNYVDAADMLLFGDTRDEGCYMYASQKFNSLRRPQYSELSSTVRKYIAALKGERTVGRTIRNREELNECLEYLWNYVIPFTDKYNADDIASLCSDESFLKEYKLTTVITFL